jgi:hypothetical protein
MSPRLKVRNKGRSTRRRPRLFAAVVLHLAEEIRDNKLPLEDNTG